MLNEVREFMESNKQGYKTKEGFIRQQIHLPADEYDKDDELDDKLEAIERRKRKRITREGFYGV